MVMVKNFFSIIRNSEFGCTLILTVDIETMNVGLRYPCCSEDLWLEEWHFLSWILVDFFCCSTFVANRFVIDITAADEKEYCGEQARFF